MLYPVEAAPSGIAGIGLFLLDELLANPVLRGQLKPEYWLTATNAEARRSYQRGALPPVLARIARRLGLDRKTAPARRARVTSRYLAELQDGDVAWLFPSVRAAVYQEARRRGTFVVKELVNTALAYHRAALVRAYDAIGWQPGYLPPREDIDEECEQLSNVDRFFAPSVEVANSFIAAGADPGRIFATSYGWCEHRFQPVRRPTARLRFLFVAYGAVRKGLPHLLNAWEKAGLDADLVLVGGISPEVEAGCAKQLQRSNVIRHGHVSDLAPHYGGADVFVLPSFEEGSPLVSYEALAAGLPCLMTPHSAGEVVRDGVEGLLAPAGDQSAWVDLLSKVAADETLRERLGKAARARSLEFTWKRVAERRFAHLAQLLSIN
ncbi:MAG: glycosyltransferase family 4 protein [Planctomycetota bacterium]